jgi:thiamine-monophosphate kinase
MLPSDITEDWLHSFVEGLKTDQHNFDIVLLGGDTTRTLGELAISVTMLGFVPSGKTLRRNGAKPGDDIYVSGTIGDAALGLPIAQTPLNHESRITNHHFLNRYQLPEPRIVLGQHLRSIATSCMDISDGLAQDLGHICKASGVGAVIEWEKVPLSAAARECNPSPEAILAGGDDYELLFTVPHDQLQAITMLAKEIPITHIGRVVAGHGVQVMGGNGEILALSQTGFRHF